MNASKLFVSGAASLVLSGTIGLAFAQTPPALDQTPTGKKPTGDSQAKPSKARPMPSASGNAPMPRPADNMGTGMGNTGAKGNSPTATPVPGARSGAATAADMGMPAKPMSPGKKPPTKGAERAASGTPI